MAQNDIIVYNFLHLENCSKRMGWIVDALDEVKEITSGAGESAAEYWQGEAYDAFKKQIDNMNSSLEKLYEQVSASKDKLDTAITMEKENEANITQKTVDGLSADNIF